MNLLEHLIPFKITETNNKEIFGYLRYLIDKHELIFYDREYNEFFKENLKNFYLDTSTTEDKVISLMIGEKKISIFKEKDVNSDRVFNLIQFQLNKFSTLTSSLNKHNKQ